jgi:hypothetical protein
MREPESSMGAKRAPRRRHTGARLPSGCASGQW